MCVQQYALWLWAEEKIAAANKADPNGESGLIETAQSGYRMQSAYLQISKAAIQEYGKLKSCFGLSPSDRTHVTQSDPQLSLFGDAEPTSTNPFLRL